jgi:hypothetical protein
MTNNKKEEQKVNGVIDFLQTLSSKIFNLDSTELINTLEDLKKIINTRQEFIATYKTLIENPERLEKNISQVKTEAVNYKTQKNIIKNENKISIAKSFDQFKDVLSTIEDSGSIDEIIKTLSNKGNVFAKTYQILNKYKGNLDALASETQSENIEGVKDIEQKELVKITAQKLYNKVIETAQEIEDVLDFKSLIHQQAKQIIFDSVTTNSLEQKTKILAAASLLTNK